MRFWPREVGTRILSSDEKSHKIPNSARASSLHWTTWRSCWNPGPCEEFASAETPLSHKHLLQDGCFSFPIESIHEQFYQIQGVSQLQSRWCGRTCQIVVHLQNLHENSSSVKKKLNKNHLSILKSHVKILDFPSKPNYLLKSALVGPPRGN